MAKTQIFGFSGTFASGKDTLANILMERGFHHVSTGDMVRVVAQEKYGSVERPILKKMAQECREQYGAGYFVTRALETADRPVIVSGLRSLGEAKAIIEAGGTLVFIDADSHIRYERMRSRHRDNEALLDYDEFIAKEEGEQYGGPEDTDFNLRAIKEMASVRLTNNTSLDEFIDGAFNALNISRDE